MVVGMRLSAPLVAELLRLFKISLLLTNTDDTTATSASQGWNKDTAS